MTSSRIHFVMVLDEQQIANKIFIDSPTVTEMKADFLVASSSYKKIKELLS